MTNDAQQGKRLLRDLDVCANECLYLTEIAVHHVLQPGHSCVAEFEIGLGLIRDGLKYLQDRCWGSWILGTLF